MEFPKVWLILNKNEILDCLLINLWSFTFLAISKNMVWDKNNLTSLLLLFHCFGSLQKWKKEMINYDFLQIIYV